MNEVVQVGERRTFRSSLHGVDGDGILVRLYTGQEVEVVEPDGECSDDTDERLFRVRADDGTVFSAWETELIPHAQSHYVTPSGEYVTDPEFRSSEEES